MQGNLPLIQPERNKTNNDHSYGKLDWCVKQVLPAKRKSKKEQREEGAMETFLKEHATHPSIQPLQTAIIGQDTEGNRKLVSQISADSWHDCLRQVSRSNARSIYVHLARMEGRNQKGQKPGDLAPLLHKGEQATGHRQKCEIIAEHVREKMAAPSGRGKPP